MLADLAWSRRHGFGAKLCIHPAQVEPIHTALAPDAEAVAWARPGAGRGPAASPGAARLDGRMIDRPVVLQAARTLPARAAEPHSTDRRTAMPSTIIDSAIFQGIFTTDEMRHVWSDENRTAVLPRHRGRAGQGAGRARA